MGSKAPEVKETENEKMAAIISRKEYEFARQLDPIKELYEERIAQLDGKAAENNITGLANIGAQNSINQAKISQNTTQQQLGVDPSSGRAISEKSELSNAAIDSVGRSQSEAAFAQKSAALEGMNNRIAMALGEKTKAVAGIQDIASSSQRQAIARLENKLGNKAALSGAIGTGLGLAASYGLDKFKENQAAKQGTAGSRASDYKGLTNWEIGKS